MRFIRVGDGTLWAGTLSGGLSEFRNGRFTTYTTANGISSNTVTSIAESPDGTMWFATPNGLNALSKGQWHIFTVRDGLPSADLNCLLTDSAGVLWIGSAGACLPFFRCIQLPHDAPDRYTSRYSELRKTEVAGFGSQPPITS